MNVLEIPGQHHPFIVLAPANTVVPKAFQNIKKDPAAHLRLFSEMQRLRGAIALEEGAVRAEDLDSEGRHHMPGDEDSWHLLRMSADGKIRGCARILVHSERTAFNKLRLASSAVAKGGPWSRHVRFAVETEIASAHRGSTKVVEPGGWVIEEKLRGSKEAIALALSAFAWSQLAGDCLAYVTATVKHGSSSILKRLGAAAIQFAGSEVPRYFDPEYGCEMELLKINTRSLNPRFEPMIAGLRRELACSMVLHAGHASAAAAA